jgi:hypothetical protein
LNPSGYGKAGNRLASAILDLGWFQCNPSDDRLSTIAASGDAGALIPEVRSCRWEKAMALRAGA